MESYRSKYGCMPKCDSIPSCEPMPMCERKCIGTHTTKHRVYENCYYDICKVCSSCGYEHDDRHMGCPMCGASPMMHSMGNPMSYSMNDPMDDPPQAEIFGGRGFGGFGGFGRRRFGFFPFFPLFPFSPFFFRRRRF